MSNIKYNFMILLKKINKNIKIRFNFVEAINTNLVNLSLIYTFNKNTSIQTELINKSLFLAKPKTYGVISKEPKKSLLDVGTNHLFSYPTPINLNYL